MSRPKKPAIWADAMALATEIEVAVRGFSRYHKYTLGTDLRRQAPRAAPPGHRQTESAFPEKGSPS